MLMFTYCTLRSNPASVAFILFYFLFFYSSHLHHMSLDASEFCSVSALRLLRAPPTNAWFVCAEALFTRQAQNCPRDEVASSSANVPASSSSGFPAVTAALRHLQVRGDGLPQPLAHQRVVRFCLFPLEDHRPARGRTFSDMNGKEKGHRRQKRSPTPLQTASTQARRCSIKHG